MSMGVRKACRALLAAAILLCLLATFSTYAQATFPGRPGLIVFNLKEFYSGGFSGGLFAIQPGEAQPRQLTTNPADHNPSFAPLRRVADLPSHRRPRLGHLHP